MCTAELIGCGMDWGWTIDCDRIQRDHLGTAWLDTPCVGVGHPASHERTIGSPLSRFIVRPLLQAVVAVVNWAGEMSDEGVTKGATIAVFATCFVFERSTPVVEIGRFWPLGGCFG